MPNTVRVRVLNVGQGDAIVGLLPEGDRAFVVDVYDADKVLDFLDEEGISEIVLFLSHSDRDHTEGASDFIAEFPQTGRILGIFYNQDRLNARRESDYVKLTRLIGQFSRLEERRNPDYLYANFNTNLNLIPGFAALFSDGCHVTVVHPAYADQSSLVGQDINETAGVLMVEATVGGGECRRLLLAADVQLTGISLILDRESEGSIRADVLKFPHHGAWPEDWPGISLVNVEKRTLEEFLQAVQPSGVIVSAGFKNSYGHVRQQVFELLEKYYRDTGFLEALKCTQFTPTCLARVALPNDGAFREPHCAGDIEVRLGTAVEILTFPGEHATRVAELNRVGGAGCAFLLQD